MTTLDPRSARSRAALMDAFSRGLATTSYDGLTVAAVCEEAGVGYTTFFRQFASKRELLWQVVDVHLSAIMAVVLDRVLDDDDAATAAALSRYVVEHADAIASLVEGEAGRLVEDRLTLRSLALGRLLGIDRLDLPVPYPTAARFAIAGALRLVRAWFERGRVDDGRLAGSLRHLVLEPLAGRVGKG